MLMRRPRRRKTLLVVALNALAIVSLAMGVPSASASNGGNSANTSTAEDGTSTISVSVSYTTAVPGGDGSGGTTTSTTATATVAPICTYVPSRDGAEVAEDMRDGRYRGVESPAMFRAEYPDWEKHDGDDGYWYRYNCFSNRASSREEFETIELEFMRSNPHNIWVPAGSEPPTPQVDGATLARAAWDAVTIPTPSIDRNPKLGDSGATVVGLDTWVWATGDTPTTVTATATAGSVTATVQATGTGLSLSSPDATTTCSGFGTAWQPGMAEGSSDCTVMFNRSSAHLGGTTPLRTSASYSVSWTASDGSSGTLDPVTTTSTTNIPVTEIQTINVPTPDH